MANEIHNYALETYRVGDNDYFDMDYFDGLTFTSAKIKGQYLRAGQFTQTVNGPIVTATTTESSILGAGQGSLTVPANAFQVGDTFLCKIKGLCSAHNNDDWTVRVKSGTTVLAQSSPISMPTVTGKSFELDLIFVIRAIGPSMVGSIVTHGSFCYNKDSSNAYEGQDFISVNNSTFDTTILNSLDVTIEFSSTNANNSVETYITNLIKTY
jgi:hypothetical protein